MLVVGNGGGLRLSILIFCAFCGAYGAQGIAVITRSANARVVRRDNHSQLKAVAGDLLFEGDSVLIPEHTTGSVEFTSCASSGAARNYRLISGEAKFEAGDATGAATKTGEGPACLLPEIDLDPAIAMMTERSLDTETHATTPSTADLAKMSAQDRAAFQAAEAAMRLHPNDTLPKLTRISLLQKYNLDQYAIGDLLSVADAWKDEQWARTLGYSIATAKAPAGPVSGKLYAAVIGISQYEDSKIPRLHFADADAGMFVEFLRKARAQGFAQDRIFFSLINEQARASAIQTTVKSFFAQAQAGDSILLYIAAHGVGQPKKDNGYVVLYDTKLESPDQNSWSTDDIRELLISEAARVRHAFLFVDTCHADRIGEIRTYKSSDAAVTKAAQVVTDGKVFAMYASDPNGLSYEGVKYGGGHGAFTYFLMRGLNITAADPEYRQADSDGDGFLGPVELISYVTRSVEDNTQHKQSPNKFWNIDQFQVSTRLPGLKVPPCCAAAKSSGAAATAIKGVAGTGGLRDPSQPNDARSIEWTPPPDLEKRAAFEEQSQQALYKYIRGDEVPPAIGDYQQGLSATQQALGLAGNSLYLEARAEFFSGRLALFNKTYDDAFAHLEKAIRMDPGSPYSYNALGMTLLELNRYDEAEAALQDAIRRAPNWAYPRHNLGIVYLQRGDYGRAIAAYRQAELLRPEYSYLAYNLGLIYQRLNDTDNAVSQYQLALKRAPERAAPLVALGSLEADLGNKGKAWRYYRQAEMVLTQNPEREVLLNLRHNEGALEARNKSGLKRASALWEKNIDEADYIPSRFALARALAVDAERRKNGNSLELALAQYSQLVEKLPRNTEARIEYAGVLYQGRQTDKAARVLEDGLKLSSEAPELRAALDRLRAGRNPRRPAR
jgi:tetratricopeptide (TPR) repeat protein